MNKETTKCSLPKVIVSKCVRAHFVLSSIYPFHIIAGLQRYCFWMRDAFSFLHASISVMNLGDILMEHITFLFLAK